MLRELKLCACIAGAIVSAIVAHHEWQEREKAIEASLWVTTEAVILWSDVEGDCSVKQGAYGPKVSYQFIAGGVRYVGHRINFGSPTCGTQTWAKREVEKYPARTKILAYVNPKNPAEATLSIKAPNIFNTITAALLTALFLAIATHSVRKMLSLKNGANKLTPS